jgi:hypothetical protein
MKTLIGALVVILLAGGLGWWYMQNSSSTSPSQTGANNASTKLAPEVEAVLTQKTEILTELAADASIVNAVRVSNEKNKLISEDEIQRMDAEWQASKTVTSFIAQFMSNPTALQLVAFQKIHPEFKEIFVTDASGLNVGQTDKTSDYYQADESWWLDSYDNGRGSVSHGSIEFDESSQTEAISLYVPVMDGGKAIGVFKGVLDLSAISDEL